MKIFYKPGFYSEVQKQIRTLFEGESTGHDLEHTLRVLSMSEKIAIEDKAECDMDDIVLIALLHDTDDHKIFKTENYENARRIMSSIGIDSERQNKICQAIGEISFSKNKDKHPSTIEAMIVQDADRLDAIGAIGIARCFSYGGGNNRKLYSMDGDDASIDHFNDKLFKLKDLMNTRYGRVEAERRDKILHEFYSEFMMEVREDEEI